MNMSYCAIENTLENVLQLINLMTEEDGYLEGLNQYERAALPRLIQACEELISLMESHDSGN